MNSQKGPSPSPTKHRLPHDFALLVAGTFGCATIVATWAFTGEKHPIVAIVAVTGVVGFMLYLIARDPDQPPD